jgi:hypothetical protein
MASGDTLVAIHPWSGSGPTTNYATRDTRNNHEVLDFDGSTDEEAYFLFYVPSNYSGNGLTAELDVGFTSATSGTSRWQADIERMDRGATDFDSDSFTGSFESAAGAAPGTSGQTVKVSIAITSGAQMDSLAAGEWARLKIRRDADATSGTDDINSDAELFGIAIKET